MKYITRGLELAHLVLGEGGGVLLLFVRYRLHSFASNPQLVDTHRFKKQSATFYKSEAARNAKRHQDDFVDINTYDMSFCSCSFEWLNPFSPSSSDFE